MGSGAVKTKASAVCLGADQRRGGGCPHAYNRVQTGKQICLVGETRGNVRNLFQMGHLGPVPLIMAQTVVTRGADGVASSARRGGQGDPRPAKNRDLFNYVDNPKSVYQKLPFMSLAVGDS